MRQCCGRKCATPYCPLCGQKALASPLRELLASVSRTAANYLKARDGHLKTAEENRHEGDEQGEAWCRKAAEKK